MLYHSLMKYTLYITLLSLFPACFLYAINNSPNGKEPLKILFIENYFPPNSSTAVLNQITEFIEDKHIVHIYAKNQGDFSIAHKDVEKYHLAQKTFWGKLPKNLNFYDIIYCQFGECGKEFVDEIEHLPRLKAKIVTCFRGADVSKYHPEYYKKLFAKGDLFLPVCTYFQNKLIALGCDPKKIKVQRSTVDSNFFSFKKHAIKKKKAVTLLSVGRLIDKKGFTYGIDAVAQLIPQYPDLKYYIIGAGSKQSLLQNQINKLKAQNNIILLGHQSQDTILSYLNQSDIFILPCITAKNGDQEGIPNSLKEAMACGVPVISTYHAGIPELIQNRRTGILIPEKNTNILAKKIDFLINNKKIWVPMCKAARLTIEQEYEKQKNNNNLIKLFYELKKESTTKK